MVEKIALAWSGGKDSTLALHEIRRDPAFEVTCLLTTIIRDYDRISMHGVRVSLLEQQASALGYPLAPVFISKNASDAEYEAAMKEALEALKQKGVTGVAFGDIFLEDLRKYREQNLARIGMKAIFPLWKRNTSEMARAFIGLGFRAVITCVDSQVLDKSFAGRAFDEKLLSELPPGIDPCGENGEFHSFVFAGPIFRQQLNIIMGETLFRDNRFYFCDFLPSNSEDGDKRGKGTK
jgi:uncharacterized protein (TIGR00290 family)